jgi:hypothetical protein
MGEVQNFGERGKIGGKRRRKNERRRDEEKMARDE